MTSIIISTILILVTLLEEEIDEQVLTIYQDGYGTYDIQSGLMLDYSLPLPEKLDNDLKHAFGGTVPKVKSTAVPYVISVDYQDIRNSNQTWCMTVSCEVDMFDMYITPRRPDVRFYITGDWVNIKPGQVTYQFKATQYSVFPFDPREFLLAQLIKI